MRRAWFSLVHTCCESGNLLCVNRRRSAPAKARCPKSGPVEAQSEAPNPKHYVDRKEFEALLVRFNKRRTAALERRLMEEFLFPIAKRAIGALDLHWIEADDAEQEAAIHCWQTLRAGRFTPGRGAAFWFFSTCAQNRARDLDRRAGNRHCRERDFVAECRGACASIEDLRLGDGPGVGVDGPLY